MPITTGDKTLADALKRLAAVERENARLRAERDEFAAHLKGIIATWKEAIRQYPEYNPMESRSIHIDKGFVDEWQTLLDRIAADAAPERKEGES